MKKWENWLFYIGVGIVFVLLILVGNRNTTTETVILNDIQIKQTVLAIPVPTRQPDATKVKPQ